MNQIQQIRTIKIFRPVPPTNPAVRRKTLKIDAEKKHLIYDRLISILEGRRFADLPYILHPTTKEALRDTDGMADAEINALESSIVEDAGIERHSSTIPCELFREYAKQGKGNVIFDERIVRVPDDDLNVTACGKLEAKFSRDDILLVPGFILDDGLFLRLDLDEYLAERGFLMPVHCGGLIVGLQVYRHS